MKPLAELSPEEKRVLAAEACGWKRPFKGEDHDWENPQGIMTRTCNLPDYGSDLNAMSGAESTMNDGERSDYVDIITNHGRRAHWGIFATAAQRLDAFLLAKGLSV